MTSWMQIGLELVLALVGGAALGWWRGTLAERTRLLTQTDGEVLTRRTQAEADAQRLGEEAERDAKALKREKLIEVRDEWFAKKQAFESESAETRTRLTEREKAIQSREAELTERSEALSRRDRQVQRIEQETAERSRQADARLETLQRQEAEGLDRLERISGLTAEQARQQLIDGITDEATAQATALVKDIRDQAKLTANREAKRIVVQAIQRTAVDHSAENTVSVLNIQSDEMKGRIIGREGRNIRAFEAATGIDVIVDDTPEAVILSGFDPFRREVARVALSRLIADGRIHPARIEEVVERARKELEDEVLATGEQTAVELGIHGLHPEIVRLVGRMKYRTSYGQNLLKHSIEVALLSGLMAAELRLDGKMAKRAGLLHDMGKVADREVEGPHAILGYEIAKRYKEHPVVANAIGAHHEEMEMETPIAVLIQAADAISGARPGARRESLDNYVKRLEKLEAVASSFPGVTKTYAIQAGREVRVLVEHDKVNDGRAEQMAGEIATKIHDELDYPGQIKVTVIREYRAVALAR